MKQSKSIIQSLKKDILKGIRRFYWYSFTKLKYFFLTIYAFIFIKDVKLLKISLLLPSRERSKKFIRLIDSINETCLNKDKIEILLLLDDDDNELDKYKKIILHQKYKKLNISKI